MIHLFLLKLLIIDYEISILSKIDVSVNILMHIFVVFNGIFACIFWCFLSTYNQDYTNHNVSTIQFSNWGNNNKNVKLIIWLRNKIICLRIWKLHAWFLWFIQIISLDPFKWNVSIIQISLWYKMSHVNLKVRQISFLYYDLCNIS